MSSTLFADVMSAPCPRLMYPGRPSAARPRPSGGVETPTSRNLEHGHGLDGADGAFALAAALGATARGREVAAAARAETWGGFVDGVARPRRAAEGACMACALRERGGGAAME
jgi:hypothetical protein